MKGNQLKGALLKRYASEMELANADDVNDGKNNENNNNIATIPVIHSDDVPETELTKKLESDAAVAKPVEELPSEKGVVVEVDTPNNIKLEEGEASTAHYDLSASVMWSGVDDLKDI